MPSHLGSDRLADTAAPPCLGVVVGSPVRGNGPPLAGRGLPAVGRMHHAPVFLVDPELPRPEMRPVVSLTGFVPTIANIAGPAPASAVSAVPAVMGWKVSRQVSCISRKVPFQTRRPTLAACRRMKMPMPRNPDGNPLLGRGIWSVRPIRAGRGSKFSRAKRWRS